MSERKAFCTECREETNYLITHKTIKHCIRGKEYDFNISAVECEKCGEAVSIPGLFDLNAKEIDSQYRKKENIIAIEDIYNLMNIYNLGKAPLSLALGFGEITITRYLEGQVPSKEYSEIMIKALESPRYMKDCLNNNKQKLGETAYSKAIKAIEELKNIFVVSDKMLLTISYIFQKVEEITPLALQKLLYYIQALFMVKYNKPLYDEECEAWIHGPVYEGVYNMFKGFKYNPIDDKRFAIFKNRFHELSDEEKQIIDLVVESFGVYSGKTLEKITHNELPWKEARKGCFPEEASKEIITKAAIKEYFINISKEYDLYTVKGINSYIKKQLQLNG